MTVYTAQNTANEEKKVELTVGDVQVDVDNDELPEKVDIPVEMVSD